MKIKKAIINKNHCVACGCCVKLCPKGAIIIDRGISAVINAEICIGCSLCEKSCPASIIEMVNVGG